MPRTKGAKARRTLLAYDDLDRLGVNPLEQLMQTRRLALEAFTSMRGYSDKGDAGVGYLGLVMRADIEMLSLKYAKLSAIAIKDITSNEKSGEKQITTEEAIKIIQSDPFSPPEIKNIDTAKVIEVMNTTIDAPFLPSGRSVDEIDEDHGI